MTPNATQSELPNGPVAAALLAGGIGAAPMGILTALSEASAAANTWLSWYNPVGALTGKSVLAPVASFASWIVLHLGYRGKNVEFSRAATIAFILLAIGLLGVFPPFFGLFAAKG